MKFFYFPLFFIATIYSTNLQAQTILADFETANSTPALTPQGVVVVDNPDKNTTNSSNKAGYMNKPAGDWVAFYLTFAETKKFTLGNTELNFKIRSAFAARVYVKVWNGSQVVIENWSTNYNFMVTPNTWTDCIFDIRSVVNQDFTRIEININGGSSNGNVYFDEFKLNNPQANNGLPVAAFTSSKPKAFAGDTVRFDASNSYDFNGRITSYNWNFQDGTTDTGKIVSHTFINEGIYHVKLTVTDNENNSTSTQKSQALYPVGSRLGRLNIVTTTPSVNTKIEGWFLINNSYSNIYNPDEVKVDALITLPNQQKITVPAFYFVQQNYQTNRWAADTSQQNWAVRFSSKLSGVHKIVMRLTDAQGTIQSAETTVNIAANATNKGIIGVDSFNYQYFRRATGEPFYPLGINVAWNNLENYTKIIGNLSAGKANFVRYWHAAFNQQQLEWKNNGFNSGIGIYSQAAAATQDSVLDLCTNKEMNLQMCLFHHGMFSENVNSNWNDNPYNVANGGYLTRAEEFFYNATAKGQTKKLLRYIVARWGYSSNLFAWELFNEVQFTGIFNSQTATWRTEVIKWHDEMGQYIKSIDAFKHVVTTSADDNQIVSMNGIAGLDNLQYHTYSNTILDNLVVKDASFLNAMTNKSIICGEYGTSTNADVPFDVQRNAIWTGITSQVPHLMWLWDNYTDPSWGLLFKQPAAFVKNEDFTRQGTLSKWSFTLSSPSTTVLKSGGFSTPKNNFYGYIYDALNQNNLGGTQMTMPNMPRGTYRIQYYMPDSARVVVMDSVLLTPFNNTIVLPVFSKGLGIKVQFLTGELVGYKDILANNSEMMVYPNPVTDDLTLEFDATDAPTATVKLFDALGRLIKTIDFDVQPNEKAQCILPFKSLGLMNGIYIVQVKNGQSVFNKKVVFQN